ncbi:PaaI family thioesterase [Natronospirillum operosum]|uniref:PaaI family thioesterase n=1 Tax=Natronospirillum operosum TaxID=2759953 RepID=A0A4Z0W6S6_9GAMM|nr:PaaI family thioesterase [Natronospirillum operosum]TGG93534.1 PaaI family thioesterase [Natronospirillum operosum]
MDKQALQAHFEQVLADAEPEFGKFFLARFYGLDIEYVGERCRVTLPIREHTLNPVGKLHGGVLATALDVSMGHLIHHVTGQGGSTVEMKIQYLRPADSGRIVCEACFLKQGRSLAFMESRATNEDGKLIAVATATWAMPKPQG